MILQSFLLGLSQGMVCMGICFPVVGTYILGEERTTLKSLKILFLFLSGRLAGYLIVSVLATFAGKALLKTSYLHYTYPAAYLILGIAMVLYGGTKVFSRTYLCRIMDKTYESSYYVLAAGFVTGINLCPPFLGIIVMSMERANLITSMLAFSSFFAATSMYLLPVVFVGRLTRLKTVRTSAAIASLGAGVFFIYKFVNIFYSMS